MTWAAVSAGPSAGERHLQPGVDRVPGQDGKAFSSTHALNGAVEVISRLNQQVSAQMVSGDLLLTVSSSASDPIVEAKQHKRKRRYVVSNSGPIETVRIRVRCATRDPTERCQPERTGRSCT